MSDDHTVRLGSTQWRVWRAGLLRAAGFPTAGLDRFHEPDTAAAADALLDGGDPGAFDAAFTQAIARLGRAVHDLAGDPLFREAITWQNPALVDRMLDSVRRHGPDARDKSRRYKENSIVRYWSRYCAKNDTIGFFGPVCWIELDPSVDGIELKPGPTPLARRQVFFEWWALRALADRLAANPEVRQWLPATPPAAVTVRGRDLLHPTRGHLTVTGPEARVLARCDGRTPVVAFAEDLAADPDSGYRRAADVLLTVGSLAERGLVHWGIDPPIDDTAERVLLDALGAIGDPAVAERARAPYDRLSAARDRVARSGGDPDALLDALRALNAEFTEVTGQEPTRAEGQVYAARTVCYEDTVRNLDARIGPAVLDAMAEPLDLLLTSARWISVEMGRAYLTALRGLYDDLAADHGPTVPLHELWYLATGLFFGDGPRPVDAVSAEFTRRWAELLDLDTDAELVTLDSRDLRDPVARAFPADRPAWSTARYHSPDLHLVARDEDALRAGDVSVVLGELHVAWNTADVACLVFGHPDPDALRQYMDADLPAGRIKPLLPADWPRLTARTTDGVDRPGDYRLGFADAPGARPDRTIPYTALTVSDDDGDLVVSTADGRRWPLIEVFADFLAIHLVDAFKLLGAFRHSPRVVIDRMVVARRTWRREVSELDFVRARTERDRYLALRRWRRETGLPERVFVKTATELKPFYADLTSPVFVNALTSALRVAARDAGPSSSVSFTEMEPGLDQAWVPDALGNRYASELRLQIVDPERSTWTGS